MYYTTQILVILKGENRNKVIGGQYSLNREMSMYSVIVSISKVKEE